MIPAFKVKKVSSVGLAPDVRKQVNEHSDAINSQRVRPGLGILVDQTSEGTTIRVDPAFVSSLREETEGRWL